MTAIFVSQIAAGAVVAFVEGASNLRGVVVEQGLTHRNDGFVHDYAADVPCVVVREEWTGRRYDVLASQLVHVYASGEAILGSGFAFDVAP